MTTDTIRIRNSFTVTIEQTEGDRWHWEVGVDTSRSSKAGFAPSVQDAESAARKALDLMMRERRPTPVPEVHPIFADEPVTEPPDQEGVRVLRTYTNR